MNLSRISRLLQVLNLLQAGRGHNANDLAQSCGVSRRTIFRDLDAIRAAGIPLQFDSELQRYHIPSAQFLPPTNFTAEEALAVIALCHELGGSGQLPFYEPARSAALKLESNLPGYLREHLRSLTRAIRITPAPFNPLEGKKGVYETLVDGIGTRHAVRIEYQGPLDAAPFSTKLYPYQLLFKRHSWYVIGRSSLHKQARTLNLARIRSIAMLKETFQIPQGFSVERYLGNAWNLVPEEGRDSEVTVRFQPLVAKNVAEVTWHKTQRLELNGDGTLDFHVTVSGLKEISWWILGYGDQAEVIRPPELRDLIAQRARNLLARYNDHPA